MCLCVCVCCHMSFCHVSNTGLVFVGFHSPEAGFEAGMGNKFT